MLDRKKKVAELHVLGWSQREIATEFGTSQPNISTMLKSMREDLVKETRATMGEGRAIQTARLELILKSYWDLFEKEGVENPETALSGALRTVAEISKLWGVNTPVESKLTVAQSTDASELASKLASIFGSASEQVVDGEIIDDDVKADIPAIAHAAPVPVPPSQPASPVQTPEPAPAAPAPVLAPEPPRQPPAAQPAAPWTTQAGTPERDREMAQRVAGRYTS